jgi:hypothetical protein
MMSRTKNFAIFVISAVATALLIVACEPSGRKVEKLLNREGKEIKVVVEFLDSTAEVTKKYRELHDVPKNVEIAPRAGFSMWPEWMAEDGESVDVDEKLFCKIYTVEPKFVDDEATLTLGHELLHCLYGSYHPGEER